MSNIKKKIFELSTIGVTDGAGAAIAAVFWFYIASQLGPENYGELTYLISIAALVSGIALFGSHTSPFKVSIERENFKAIQVDDLSKLSANKVYEKFLEGKNLDLILEKVKLFNLRFGHLL